MAQGRILWKAICESDSFAALNNTNAQLLLVLLTPWWDDYGKMIGDPVWIKGNVVRKLKQYDLRVINWCLLRISEIADVNWWTDEQGNKWLYWEKFNQHQTISDDKKHKDRLPAPKSPKIPKNPQESPTRSISISISRRGRANAPLSDQDFIKTLKENPAYNHINIDNELNKMDAWLLAHKGRQKTRRFIINWLNKIEKPLEKEQPKRQPIRQPCPEPQKPKDVFKGGAKEDIEKVFKDQTQKTMKDV